MDQSPQPSPTTPAGSPADIAPALPGSPETRPAPAEAPSQGSTPPPDPYAGLDYEEMLQEFPVAGMDVKELSTVFGPARATISQFGAPGLADALEWSGAGSDANVLRGLAAFERDYQSLVRDARQVNAELATRSSQLGQRAPRVDAPPLTGPALESAITRLLDRYLPATSSRQSLETLGFFRDPAVRRTLESMAQETSRLERALQQAGGLQQQMKSAWDSPSTLLTMPDGRKYTREELKASYGELMQEWMAADKRGDLATKARLQQQMNKVGRIAFS